MSDYFVFGVKGKGPDGQPVYWTNEHRADVVKVTDAWCLLFGEIINDELSFEHGYAAGAWKEFRRKRAGELSAPDWVVAEVEAETEL